MKINCFRNFGKSLWLVASVGVLVVAFGCGGSGGSGVPSAYRNADGLEGGMAYDKFFSDTVGWDVANKSVYDGASNFFRCKQCHGWDRLGRTGYYINRAPQAGAGGRPNVSAVDLVAEAASMTEQALFDAIKRPTNRRAINHDLSTYDPSTNATEGDKMPDFGSVFSDAQIWMLVKAIKGHMLDTTFLYDLNAQGTYPTGSRNVTNIGAGGTAATGDALFASKCASCHGADGTFISLGGSGVGGFLRGAPHETQHKALFGHPDSPMGGGLITTATQMRDLYLALTDAGNFPD